MCISIAQAVAVKRLKAQTHLGYPDRAADDPLLNLGLHAYGGHDVQVLANAAPADWKHAFGRHLHELTYQI